MQLETMPVAAMQVATNCRPRTFTQGITKERKHNMVRMGPGDLPRDKELKIKAATQEQGREAGTTETATGQGTAAQPAQPTQPAQPAGNTQTTRAEKNTPAGIRAATNNPSTTSSATVTAGFAPAGEAPIGLKILLVVALITVGCAGLYMIQDFFAPLFFALTLVLTVRPIHRWLMAHQVPGFLSATVTILVLIVFLGAVVGLVAWSLAGLPDTIMRYSDKFTQLFHDVMNFAEQRGFSTEEITQQLSKQFDVGTIISWIQRAAGSIMSTGALIGVLALCVLFLTIDTIQLQSRSRILESHDSDFYRAIASFEGRVRQYWLVATAFGLGVSVINYFVLLVLDVPMPLAWALWTFITNYIPNIGFIIGVIPPALMGLVDSGLATAIWVIVIFTLINVVIQGIIQPKFTGEAVGLSPTVTFISLLFWTVVVGPLGSILAVPLTLFFKALLVDSSPKSRWLDSFLIPEKEAKMKEERGIYEPESEAEVFVPFQPLQESRSRLSSRLSVNSSRSASRLSRAKRRASRK
ncbi:AI-2E family transporter [Actinobaculum suis]|uniref:AI-2E family transporter n=1 Tax=Actinobaculum suis TaxID=1657 RepID=UPI001E53AA5C|nr:AI-2E family transporter [Actinobaculum suis]